MSKVLNYIVRLNHWATHTLDDDVSEISSLLDPEFWGVTHTLDDDVSEISSLLDPEFRGATHTLDGVVNETSSLPIPEFRGARAQGNLTASFDVTHRAVLDEPEAPEMYVFVPYLILSEFNITKKIKMIIIPISFQFSLRARSSRADNSGCVCHLHYCG